MTEAQYQAARKVMQSANWMRDQMITAKRDIAKWTRIEASLRESLQPTGYAKKMLDKAMEMLHAARKRFADLKLPDEDFKEGVKWIAAIDIDSYIYSPKKINATAKIVCNHGTHLS